MGLEDLAKEYLRSANLLKQKILALKQMQREKSFEEQKLLEDRITLLNAEYYHLLNIASYLENYYDKSRESALLEV